MEALRALTIEQSLSYHHIITLPDLTKMIISSSSGISPYILCSPQSNVDCRRKICGWNRVTPGCCSGENRAQNCRAQTKQWTEASRLETTICRDG